MRNYFAFIIEKDRKGLKILLEKSILYSPFVARLFFYFRFNCKGRTNFGIQVFLEIKKKSRLIGTEHNLDEISSTGGEKHFFLLNAKSWFDRTFLESCSIPVFHLDVASLLENISGKLVCCGNGVWKMRWQWIESGTIRVVATWLPFCPHNSHKSNKR